MALDKLSGILSKDKKNIILKEVELQYELSKKIQKNWDIIFGKLSKEVRFSHVFNGILVVEINNPLWGTELSFYKKDLIKKINDIIKKPKLKLYDIRVRFDDGVKEKKEERILEQNLSLEDKIKEENKRKKLLNYTQCSICKTWWENGKECLFCSSSR